MALIDDVKKRIRMVSTLNDGEVLDLIDEAKSKLKAVGVLDSKIVETDPLIKCAIITYCKANFGIDNPEYEKLNFSFELIRNELSMMTDYTIEVVIE